MEYQPQPFQAQPQPHFPTFGYCESYFVENHDDDEGVYARAAAERERLSRANKLRQKAMAEELSQLTAMEYQQDVLSSMERMEADTMPDIQSIEIQTEIQWFMRPYLLDFLLEAHHAFQLLPETLHLAVNLLDRYCSRRVVYKRHYQLVGCAALLIAAKYGDRKERVPTIRELKSMCCSLYDDDMFVQMEYHVLHTLNWAVGHPTVSSFLSIALTEGSYDPELEHMTSFLMEMTLYHKEFIPVPPSIMSRSALALARTILGRQQPRHAMWSAQFDATVAFELSNHISTPSQALSRKYAATQLSSVSTTLEMFLARERALAARAYQAPASQLPHVQMTETPSVHNPYLTPSTPQKPGFAPIHVGVLTPPITPDKFNAAAVVSNPLLYPRVPSTSTPPSSAEHQHHTHFAPQYVPQPQFVS